MAVQLAVGQTVYFSWWEKPEYGYNEYSPGYYRVELWAGRGANGMHGTPGGKGAKITLNITLFENRYFYFTIGAAGNGRSGGWSYDFKTKQWIETYKGGDGGWDNWGATEWGGGGGGGSRLCIGSSYSVSSVAYAGGGGGGCGWYNVNWYDYGEDGNSYGRDWDSAAYVSGYKGHLGDSLNTTGKNTHCGGGGGGGGFNGGNVKPVHSDDGSPGAGGGYGGRNYGWNQSDGHYSVTSNADTAGDCNGDGYAAITFLGYLQWSISWVRMKNVNRNTAMAGDLIYGDADITATRYNAKGQKFYVNPAYGIFSSISYSNVDSPSITNDGLHFQGYQRHRQTAYVAANFYRYIITCNEHCYLVNGEDVLLPGNRYRVKLKHTKVGILLFRYWTISGGLNVTYPARDEIEFEMPNGNVSIVAHYPNRLNTDAYKDIKEQDSFLYEKIE